MKHILTLAALVFATACFGQDTTVVCGYQYTPPNGGGLFGGWPYSDVFIPSENEVVSIFADFERPNYSGSALDFAAAYCSGCSELELSSWTLEWPSSYLWNYDTIPYPMYQTELDFTQISNAAVVGPGFLRILAPINEEGWGDLCVGFRSLTGCADEMACNFSNTPGLISDPELCIYDCCPGPSCCGQGMHWDWVLSECVIDTPSDTDFDGCVGMTDLLDLLSVFGTCNEIPWSCGEPLEYQDYDYETVQIGEQCWFAENSRYLPAVSPSSIGSEIDGNAHAYVFEYEGQDIQEARALENYESYGVLYNRIAMQTWDVCPAGWHVPTDSNISGQGEFWELIAQFVETEVAVELKSDFSSTPGWNGSNNSGFDALPAGYRRVHSTQGYGFFGGLGDETQYWAVETWSRRLTTTDPDLSFMGTSEHWGLSVRCIQDPE